jgi:hypothetical protein
MIEPPEITAKLDNIDQILSLRFRRDVVGDCNQKTKDAVDGFNAWTRESAEALDQEQKGLETQLAELNAFHAGIESSNRQLTQQQLDRRNSEDIERHNRLVEEHNAAVRKHGELARQFTERQNAYNARVRRRNEEMQQKQCELTALQESIKKEFQEYELWRNARGEEQFFREVNQLYATLHEELGEAGDNAGTIKAYYNQLRLIRKELATYARRREQEAENGVLVMSALLSKDEECHLVVDTGSTLVTISPELVRVLGLTRSLAEEVEVVLPGGHRARGRKLILPSLSVQGMEAQNVEAVQLEESQCGIDGLLGLSYLNRFNYMVEREKPQRLHLSLKGDAIDTYDVFISYNSDDEWWARIIFDALTVMKYRPFLSDISLRELGHGDFGKAIESAISSARHMVVVGSSNENLTSPWVEKEWRFFIHLQLLKRKTGNLIAIPCGTMTAEDLPPGLSYYQAVPIFHSNFRERLRDFLPLC